MRDCAVDPIFSPVCRNRFARRPWGSGPAGDSGPARSCTCTALPLSNRTASTSQNGDKSSDCPIFIAVVCYKMAAAEVTSRESRRRDVTATQRRVCTIVNRFGAKFDSARLVPVVVRFDVQNRNSGAFWIES